ncbi:GAF and ANTAR domain-containing protein [Rhodococcoides yunnanense]|uniref:GAF and ANTAR domain-containing protein n=1 Tax=Rhodococcoides yunnanense TaxID=278209 RepID=UPI0009342C01|nr:GAF and ANTAR domain-containing protein [Rhodococcus yunnanensis]
MKDTSRVDDSRPDSASSDSALETFRALLRSHARVETLLQSVCNQVVATVSGADMAGVTLPDERTGDTATAACTDSRVFTVDTDQFRSNQGPCLDAARTGRMIRARLGDIAVRWPRFAADAADVGVRSVLSAPISVDTTQIGSLNVYSWTDHGFTDTDEILVKVFAAAVESAIWNSRRAQEAQTELDGLREAMRTRAAIEQAKGIVMAVRGVDADAAFEVLSLQSQSENVKLSVIATRIVDSVRRDL